MAAFLFAYGTLQKDRVQIASFGRLLAGRADALQGYRKGRIPIGDPAVEAELGETHYANVEPSHNAKDSVAGMVYEVTEADLAAADQYEADAGYCRVPVTLRSGVGAWVYVRR